MNSIWLSLNSSSVLLKCRSKVLLLILFFFLVIRLELLDWLLGLSCYFVICWSIFLFHPPHVVSAFVAGISHDSWFKIKHRSPRFLSWTWLIIPTMILLLSLQTEIKSIPLFVSRRTTRVIHFHSLSCLSVILIQRPNWCYLWFSWFGSVGLWEIKILTCEPSRSVIINLC